MKIEKNIPLPEQGNRKKDEFYYVAKKMQIGDSVFFEHHKDALKLKCRLDVRCGKNRKKYPETFKIKTLLNNGVYDLYNVNVPWTAVKKENNGWRCWFIDGIKTTKEKYGDIDD